MVGQVSPARLPSPPHLYRLASTGSCGLCERHYGSVARNGQSGWREHQEKAL